MMIDMYEHAGPCLRGGYTRERQEVLKVRCMLPLAYRISHIAYRMLHAVEVCCMLPVAHRISHIACCRLHVACCVSHAAYMSHVACRILHYSFGM